jgi:7-carboxy-7-deazaguanine synthase
MGVEHRKSGADGQSGLSLPLRHPATLPLPIAETFLSIQGEGKLTGVPSFFIRVSGCNLRCGWCDTPYASWKPEGGPRTVEELAEEAGRSGARHAVVTGGEPMMFPEVIDLCAALRARGMHVTIETAGTIARGGPVLPLCDLMSISPKLSSSTPAAGDPRDPGGVWRRRHEERRLNFAALQALLDTHLSPGHQLKFVVTGPADLEEIEGVLGRLTGWAAEDVLLMPEGVTPPSQETKRWLAGECIRRGWRYCPRLHIELFGNKRGT